MIDPLVSIIIPCYNAEQWVASAIQSGIDQSWENKEIIVIDDGSTDGSLSVIKAFDGRIRWETGPNKHVSATRNRGLELARGEWIQFLDADDVLHPAKLELALAAYRRFPDADFVYTSFEVVEHGTASTSAPWPNAAASETSLETDALQAQYAPWAAMFPLQFLRKVGPWDERLTRFEDLEYHARIAVHTNKYVWLKRPLHRYRQHSGPRISSPNRDHTKIQAGFDGLRATVLTLEQSSMPPEDWRGYLFPFYVLLGRSCATRGNLGLFVYALSKAAALRGQLVFSLKCKGAILAAKIFGIRFADAMLKRMLWG